MEKWYLITGASGGLGEQLAYECAKQQAGLILVARREEVLKQVANTCQQMDKSTRLLLYL